MQTFNSWQNLTDTEKNLAIFSKSNMDLPIDPSMPLLVLYAKKIYDSFFERLFLLAKTGDKNVYQWYIHITGYYKVIKMNGKRHCILGDLHDTWWAKISRG